MTTVSDTQHPTTQHQHKTLLGLPKQQKLIGFDGSKSNSKDLQQLVEFDAPVPQPDHDDVLVHVTHSSINPVDWKLAVYNFMPGQLAPPHKALGFDYAGKVAAIGKGVSEFKVGDEVFGYLYLPKDGSWGGQGNGTFQVAHKDLTVKREPGFPAAAAGTYAIAYLSAWDAIEKHLEPNKSVLIPGAGGGVAHYAIQLAKLRTGAILTSASRPETEALARAFGVATYNHKTEKAENAIKKVAPGGADLVFDATYSETSFVDSAKALAQGGKLVILGPLPDEGSEPAKIVQSKNGHLIQADLIRYFLEPEKYDKKFLKQGFEAAQQLYLEGKVKPHISKTINATVQELQQALEENKAGKGVGKVAVTVAYGGKQ